MGFQGDNQAAVLKIKLITQKYDLQELLLMKQMNAYHIPFNNINSYVSWQIPNTAYNVWCSQLS